MTHPLQSMQKPLLFVALTTVLLLLVPAVAMQFTNEVAWGPGDFLVGGILLFGAGAIATLGIRQVRTPGQRFAVVAVVALGLALVWAELAVGIFS